MDLYNIKWFQLTVFNKFVIYILIKPVFQQLFYYYTWQEHGFQKNSQCNCSQNPPQYQILQNSDVYQKMKVGEIIRKHFLESDGKCPGMGSITDYFYRNSYDSFWEFDMEEKHNGTCLN